MTENKFHKILENKVKENKSRLIFQKKDGWSWKQITWLDFDSEVRSIASYLLDLGFSCGDRVLIISPNGLDCIFTECAVLLLGGICIPLSENEKEENIEYILSNNNIKYVFLSDETLLSELSDFFEKFEDIEKIFTFSDSRFSPESKVISFKNVIKFGYLKRKKLNDTINEQAESINPESPAIELYCFREGTESKIITQEMFIKLMELVNKKLRFISKEDQFYSLLSNSNSFSRLVSFLPVYTGSRGAMAAYPKDFLKDVKEIMPTIIFLSHDTLEKLAGDSSVNNNGSSSLKKNLGGRVKYIFTDVTPAFSAKSSFFTSGISIIELNELALMDC